MKSASNVSFDTAKFPHSLAGLTCADRDVDAWEVNWSLDAPPVEFMSCPMQVMLKTSSVVTVTSDWHPFPTILAQCPKKQFKLVSQQNEPSQLLW